MRIRIYGTPQQEWRCKFADLDVRTIAWGDNLGKRVVDLQLMGPRGGEKASLCFSRAQVEELGHALLTLAQEIA